MKTVIDIAQYLKSQNERNYVLFMTGIYSGLRVSDILDLRIRDVRNRTYISIREKKTKKEKRFTINSELRKIISDYVKDKQDFEYLISNPADHKALSRQQAYNIIRSAGERFGVYNLGTHTMRKTFGYHMYRMTNDAVMLMKLFNHADVQITLRYIGITQDEMDSAVKKLRFR